MAASKTPQDPVRTDDRKPAAITFPLHGCRGDVLLPVIIAILPFVVFWRQAFLQAFWWVWDVRDYFFAYHEAARRILQSGALPLWNPYAFSGMPLLGDGQTAMFYPPNWLFFLMPAPAALDWAILLEFSIAGVGMYLYTRGLGLSRAPSVTSAVVYMFSGFRVSRIVLSPLDPERRRACPAGLSAHSPRAARVTESFLFAGHLGRGDLLLAIFPFLRGSVQTGIFGSSLPGADAAPGIWESGFYVGIIPLVLAVVAVIGIRREGGVNLKSLTMIWCLITAAARFSASGATALWRWVIMATPFIGRLRGVYRVLVLADVGLAVLAGIGLQRILVAGRQPWMRRRLLAIAMCGVVLPLTAGIAQH